MRKKTKRTTSLNLPIPLRRELDAYAKREAYGNRSRAAVDLLIAGLAALSPKPVESAEAGR